MSEIPPSVPQPPLPVMELTYATPRAGRPGMLTVIGVLSIVFSIIGIIGGACGGFYAGSMLMVGMVSSSTFGPPPTPVVSGTVSMTDTEADTWSPERIAAVLDAMVARHPLSDQRRELLEILLANHGDEFFPVSDMSADELVDATVSDAGSTDGGDSDYFVLGEGRIEIDDDYAYFVPTDRSETFAVELDDRRIDNWESGLTDEQIEAAIDYIDDLATKTVTRSERQSLRAHLSDPNQTLLSPAPTIGGITWQINSATRMPDNSLYIYADNGTMQVSAQGTVVNSAPFGAGGMPQIAVGGSIMAAVGQLASLGLAILLLVAGIMMLRDVPVARRLHLIYAWAKIPAVLLMVIGWTWVAIGFFNSITAMSPVPNAGPGSGVMLTSAIVGAVWGCGYPIALLFVFRTRTMRDYYAGVV